jgi:hypothetical protein
VSFSGSNNSIPTQSSFRRRPLASSIAALVLLAGLLPLYGIQVDGLRVHVAWLSSPELAGRRSGQPGATRTAEYLRGQFARLGFDARFQEFGNNRRNVIARLGSSPRHIVIGAHYDGQPARPSASDNAAGVALLLELAEELKTASLPISLVLIAFDDEEQGLNGSRFYVDNPLLPLEETMAVLVFDTMGRSFIDLKQTTLFALGTENSRELAGVVSRHFRNGMLVAGTDLIGARSDFAPFAVKRVPYLFFTHGTHKDYHGPGDRPELLNYAKLAEDGALIKRLVIDIANLRTKPAYLAEPAYPEGEIKTLLGLLSTIQAEKKDLPAGYRLVIQDMRERMLRDSARDTLRVAASAMLALATPEFSPFMLDLIVAPYYEKQNRPDIVRAVGEESARWK